MAKNHQIRLLLIPALFLLLANCAWAQIPSAEEILDYQSDIYIFNGGDMIVTETITVTATGDQIKHGIYRDFPTKYRDQYGNNYAVDFQILEVKKDGQPEEYFTENLSNGVRIYIGKKDVLLNPGTYTYLINYETRGQLGFFEDHDELYWNVTGNGWVFPIKKASARVSLPNERIDLTQITTTAYTGVSGSKEQDYTFEIVDDRAIFETTKPLAAYEGLTIVVGWPKGFVAEPTKEERTQSFIWQNLGLAIALVGLIIVLVYYFFAWSLVGRDPKKEAIIAQYESPRGFSPALIGYIHKMGYRSQLLTAAIINLAIKGFIKIEKDRNYELVKLTKDDSKLAEEEKALAEEFFHHHDSLTIKESNHEEISYGILELKKSLDHQANKKYVNYNLKYTGIGLGLSLPFIILSQLSFDVAKMSIVIFMTIWLSIWTIGVTALSAGVYSLWKAFFEEKNIAKFLAAVFLSVFALPFFFGEIFGLIALSSGSSPLNVLMIAFIMIINGVFLFLLRAPTVEGRKIMDEIEGFKLFLSVTEKDRMNFHNPPDKTPELFEQFLPYALALGVQNQWAEQFTDVFNELHEEGHDYHPGWYAGALAGVAIGDFTNSLGNSFSSAISSASTAPGSSSGFSGGGSSGGGGGGGGGGGW